MKNSPVGPSVQLQARHHRARGRRAATARLVAPPAARRRSEAATGVEEAWTMSTRRRHLPACLCRAGWPARAGRTGVSRTACQLARPQPPLWEMHLIEGLEGAAMPRSTTSCTTAVRRQTRDGAVARTCARPTPVKPAADLGGRSNKHRERPGKAPPPAPAAEVPGGSKSCRHLGQGAENVRGARPLRRARRDRLADTRHRRPSLNGVTPKPTPGTVSLSIPDQGAGCCGSGGGATVNEILLAVCGGALRRYLRDRDAHQGPLIAARPVAQTPRRTLPPAMRWADPGVAVRDVANPKQRLLAVVASSRANKGPDEGSGRRRYATTFSCP